MNNKQINKWTKNSADVVYAGTTNRRVGLVIHHTAVKQSIKEQWLRVFNSHTKINGWSGGGYNFIIEADGAIFQYRAVGTDLVAHTGYNRQHLAICLAGNMNYDSITESQLKSLRKLVVWLNAHEGKEYHKPLIRHGDIGKTECPGANINLSEIENYITKQGLIEQLQVLLAKLKKLLALKK